MRRTSNSPARQLHSAALRYSQWSAAADTGGSRPGWQTGKLQTGKPLNRGGGAETPALETPQRRDPRLARVEAVLLLAREPLSSRRVAQLAALDDGTEARTLIRRLNDLYDAAGRAFRVEEVAGGYQLLTRAKFAPWVRRLAGGGAEIRLSQPAMETLAVVAYRQPVLRAEIEAVRGVQCGEILRQLMERGMVRIVGRADELGRPILYGTTKKFLQVFGLRHLDELPRAATLRRQAGSAAILSDSDLAAQQEAHAMTGQTMTGQTMTGLMTSAVEDLEERRLTAEELEERRRLRAAADEDDDLDDEDDDEDDDEEDDAGDDEWEEVDDEDDEEDDEDEDDEDWKDDDDEEWEEDEEDEDWGDDDEEDEEEEEEEDDDE